MTSPRVQPDFEWEIIYDDHSTFSNLDGQYWQAPRTGVEVVLQRTERAGVAMLHSPDGWWFWKSSRWFPATREGMDDYRRSHMSPEICILEGRWVTDEEWDAIHRTVAHRKSAWYRWERPISDRLRERLVESVDG